MDINKAIRKQNKSTIVFCYLCALFFLCFQFYFSFQKNITFFITFLYLMIIDLLILMSIFIRMNKEKLEFKYDNYRLYIKSGISSKKSM